MKNNNLLVISLCILTLGLMSSCEKTEIHKSSAKIENRSDCVDECADCPIEDCCCSVTITEGGLTTLELCGITDPCLTEVSCSAEAGSCSISGYTLNMTLSSSGTATGLFCVAKNTPFYILSTAPVTARITCRVGLTPPQVVTAIFNSPPNDKAYYTVNSDCEIASCF